MAADRVGIREVAEAAGVSITTVSHALNDKGRVTPETRVRIRRIAESLGYQPHRAARHLAERKSGIIAMLVSTAAEPNMRLIDYDYFRSLMDGCASEALARGRWIVLTPTGTKPEALTRLDLDGALLVDPTIGDPMLAMLRENGIPVVITGRDPERSEAGFWVDNDLALGTKLVLDHFHEQGARRIALLNAPTVHSYAQDAARGYEEWRRDHDLPRIIATVDESLDETAGYARARELLSGPDRPDAIFAILDRVALGAMVAAESAGLRVPDDLLIAATTNGRTSRTMRPALTTLELNQEDVGRIAVEMLIDLIEDRIPRPAHRIVPVSLIVRETSVRG